VVVEPDDLSPVVVLTELVADVVLDLHEKPLNSPVRDADLGP
jgi:hypothetical protein